MNKGNFSGIFQAIPSVWVLCLLLPWDSYAAVLKGPYLIYGGVNTEMTVLWQLDSTQSCSIEWGQDLSYTSGSGNTVESGGGINEHQHMYTISGLVPGAKYFYQVNCVTDSVGGGSFYAAPSDNSDRVKFMAYGDSRRYPADFNAVNRRMIDTYTNDPSFQTIVLHVGDWVTLGNEEADWAEQVFDPQYAATTALMASMPVNSAIGNHEDTGLLFYKYFPYPYLSGGFYWSFDYGPMHVAIIDQYVDYSPGSVQYNWLASDLANSKKKWKFLVLHEPGWSAGYVHENNTSVQDYIQPLAVKYGVAVVFGGDNHYYARAEVDGVQHVTTGGAGAPLYKYPDPTYPNIVAVSGTHHFCEISIQGNTLFFTAREDVGTVLDSFRMTLFLPQVAGLAVTDIGSVKAVARGEVLSTGKPLLAQHGVCWNTRGVPTTLDTCVKLGEIAAPQSFTAVMTDLSPGTTYHVRAYAVNSVGTAYSKEVTFTTAMTRTFPWNIFVPALLNASSRRSGP